MIKNNSTLLINILVIQSLTTQINKPNISPLITYFFSMIKTQLLIKIDTCLKTYVDQNNTRYKRNINSILMNRCQLENFYYDMQEEKKQKKVQDGREGKDKNTAKDKWRNWREKGRSVSHFYGKQNKLIAVQWKNARKIKMNKTPLITNNNQTKNTTSCQRKQNNPLNKNMLVAVNMGLKLKQSYLSIHNKQQSPFPQHYNKFLLTLCDKQDITSKSKSNINSKLNEEYIWSGYGTKNNSQQQHNLEEIIQFKKLQQQKYINRYRKKQKKQTQKYKQHLQKQQNNKNRHRQSRSIHIKQQMENENSVIADLQNFESQDKQYRKLKSCFGKILENYIVDEKKFKSMEIQQIRNQCNRKQKINNTIMQYFIRKNHYNPST